MTRRGHPAEEALLLHADDAAGAEVAHHLETCAACRAAVRRAGALDDLLASPLPLPDGLEKRLLAIPETARPPARAWIGAAAAALLL
ncbi:MAG: hypothetical protein ACC662_08820, partial [Planctomycetota bacterium]